jgi:hypothetical protein
VEVRECKIGLNLEGKAINTHGVNTSPQHQHKFITTFKSTRTQVKPLFANLAKSQTPSNEWNHSVFNVRDED